MRKSFWSKVLLPVCALVLAGCGNSSQPPKDTYVITETVLDHTDIETSTDEIEDEPASWESPVTEGAQTSETLPEDPLQSLFYQSQRQVQISEGTLLTLTLYGREFSDGYGISQIDVKKNDTLLQTIMLADYLSENSDNRQKAEAGYTFGSDRDSGLRVEDVNFDGLPDLGLEINAAREDVPYYFFLWNSDKQQFVYAFRLLDPATDAQNKQILCRIRSISPDDTTDYYEYAENGALLWTRREVRSKKDDGTEYTEYYLVKNGEFLPDFRVTSMSKTMYVKKAATVRSGNSTTYDKLGKLAQNDEVKVTGQCKNGWYQIAYKDKTGYVAEDSLSGQPVSTDATKPSDASKPSDATNPSDASKPSDATNPSDASKPSDATNPSDASKPSDATNPSDASKPSDATNPSDASKPSEPSQPANPNTAGYMDDFAQSVLKIVNEKRAENGVGALTMNETLLDAAKLRATETSQSFSHTRPDGSTCFTAFNVAYSTAGENIAAGQATPEDVMNSWMTSDGHRANILDGSFTQIAIACYYVPESTYKYYWVQLFIG